MHIRGFAGALASLGMASTLWLATSGTATAGGCGGKDPLQARDLASRISAVACREHRLWYEPFLDIDGHLASTTVAEMETGLLGDGATPAWKRVVDYWRGSGLLGEVAQRPGASTCEYVTNDSYASPNCRGFLIDTPWSAAFVSYVMVQSGVPGFGASPSHIDYVRHAHRDPGGSPFLIADPLATEPADGDLLCFVRGASAVADHTTLVDWLDRNGSGALAMHCDVVVDANGDGDGRAYLVGGNILQGVTMRILPINRAGRFWNLPQGRNIGCRPDNARACSFNNQHWVALLKLKPGLSMSPPPTIPAGPQAPPAQRCCVHCVVGSGVPRCPPPPSP
ncbi:DUF2272 domain-containing protein [Marilutibacter chinensis]|uniref:DUF2272 domain-containing protein n=1 Tax=Marilutibacter chinensis TaxID=2912247 RepID=A0ABS9HNB5_9GAMM|nr:DUF2272 domain-containing protein [Lysobacter chinensis]MCF7220494.1 DUF2272 domain-containing protein [Lysobacter chinensis]